MLCYTPLFSLRKFFSGRSHSSYRHPPFVTQIEPQLASKVPWSLVRFSEDVDAGPGFPLPFPKFPEGPRGLSTPPADGSSFLLQTYALEDVLTFLPLELLCKVRVFTPLWIFGRSPLSLLLPQDYAPELCRQLSPPYDPR